MITLRNFMRREHENRVRAFASIPVNRRAGRAQSSCQPDAFDAAGEVRGGVKEAGLFLPTRRRIAPWSMSRSPSAERQRCKPPRCTHKGRPGNAQIGITIQAARAGA